MTIQGPSSRSEAIRRAIASSTCSSSTVHELGLLLGQSADGAKVLVSTAGAQRGGHRVSKSVSQAPRSKARLVSRNVVLDTASQEQEQLQPAQQAKVATEVVNATLKSLTEAVKCASESKACLRNASKSQTHKLAEGACPSPRPLQARSVNRPSATPSGKPGAAIKRAAPIGSDCPNTGLRYTAECCHTAFTALREHEAQNQKDAKIPPLQIELGMSVFIGKLVALSLEEHAVGELRILIERICPQPKASNSKNGVSRLQAQPEKTSLPSLLHIRNAPSDGKRLSLLITSHMQILKLIGLHKRASIVEEAATLLDRSGSETVVRCIERLAEGIDGQALLKCAQQLEQVAHQVNALCLDSSIKTDPLSETGTHPSPEHALRLGIFAFEASQKSWNLASGDGEAFKVAITRLCSQVRAYGRRSKANASSKFKLLFRRLQYTLENRPERALTAACASAFDTLESEIYSQTAIFAYEAGDSRIAFEHSNKWLTCLRNSQGSEASISSALCQMACVSIKAWLGDSSGPDPTPAMQSAVESLQGNLSGTSADIDGLLVSLASLRKASLQLLKEPTVGNTHPEILESLRASSKSAIHLCVQVLTRVLVRRSSTSDAVVSVEGDRRLEAIAKAMFPAIETLSMLSRPQFISSISSLTDLDHTLQECLILTAQMNRLSKAKGVKQLDLVEKMTISISNIYWSMFSYCKQKCTDSTQSRTMLKKTIAPLLRLSTATQGANFLHIKLEKLVEMYEVSNEHLKAVDTCIQALKVFLGLDHLPRALSQKPFLPPTRLLATNDKLSFLTRLLTTFTRNLFRLPSDSTNHCLTLIELLQDPLLRGTILELQLSVILDSAQGRVSSSRLSSELTTITDELLKVYGVANHPIRRLRVIVELQRAKLLHNSIQLADHGDLLQLEKDQGSNHDGAMVEYRDHLMNRLRAYQVISVAQADHGPLRDAITFWQKLASSASSWDDMLVHIDEPSRWMQQLDTIAEYAHMKGFDELRAKVLELLHRVQWLNPISNISTFTSTTCGLALQLSRLGQSDKSAIYFGKAKEHLGNTSLPHLVALQWHLGYSEYLIGIGHIAKGNELAIKASEIFKVAFADSRTVRSRLKDKYMQSILASELLQLHSLVATASGWTAQALYCTRKSMKLLYRAWALLERQYDDHARCAVTSGSESEGLTDGMASLSLSVSRPPILSNKHDSLKSSTFWPLVPRLHQRLLHLSQLLCNEGLLTEAQHHVESAMKIANAVEAAPLTAAIVFSRATIDSRLGSCSADINELDGLIGNESGLTKRRQIELGLRLASIHRQNGTLIEATRYLELAQESVDSFIASAEIDTLPTGVTKLHVEVKPNSVATKTPRATKGRPPVRRPKAIAATKQDATASEKIGSESSQTCVSMRRLRIQILLERCSLTLQIGNVEEAAQFLQDVQHSPAESIESVKLSLQSSRFWLRKGLDSISLDPVFSLLLDSTVSCPSTLTYTSSSSKNEEQNIPAVQEIPGKSLVTAKKQRTKQVVRGQNTKEYFQRAFESLSHAHSQAQYKLSTTDLHSMADVFRKALLMMASTNSLAIGYEVNSTLTAYAMEIGRAMAFTRQKLSITVEQLLSAERDVSNLVDFSATTFLDLPTISANKFQSEYIDIIPSTWSVVSLAMSENREELLLSRCRTGQSPFILTIPLQRHNSRDCEEESFAFKDGKAEMKEIVGLANFSTHDSGNMSRVGAKNEWWEARAALDARMKDLLVNIENIWLGGFRGIFSQHIPRPELLSRFQQSFYNTLDKHLPSRQRGGKNTKIHRVILDSRVLELFVGLGKPSEDLELDEPLMDLLYFVVDILQFNGERNAYDEIDFDPMVVEVLDALTQYHEAASEESTQDEHHTILILDKALHAFPWESMPCLNGLAVSRLPSLTCLRDRLLQAQDDSSVAGIQIDPTDGAYILNPGGDLSTTQTTFASPLNALTGWSATIRRAPTESDIVNHLSTRSIYLYFGHGSGAQYIRPRCIKRLKKCAVALLMGCSSGSMTECGDFESYGTPLDYLHGGAPAVVGTLWDVTDKDIDRFSLSMLEKWGLIEGEGVDKGKTKANASPVKKAPKAKGRGKHKVVEENENMKKKVSLDKAVAESRESCIFRYLNGAATVVYGVPVHLA